MIEHKNQEAIHKLLVQEREAIKGEKCAQWARSALLSRMIQDTLCHTDEAL